jgi:protein-S-isoprenylcysteine O-methyltransferase Ste14
MNLNDITLIIVILWILSEIILAVVKRSGLQDSLSTDKYSLRIIWITIAIFTVSGGYISSMREGHIYGFEHLFRIIGLILIVSGIIFRWTAILTLKKYFTVDVAVTKEQKIVKSGMYQYIRHPSYSGSLLSFLGLGIFYCSWISLIAVIIPIFTAFSYRISVEEKALAENFGEEYVKYADETKKLIPGIY